jgi:hypothetical protein
MGYAPAGPMRNVLFTAGPKNGDFVNMRMSKLHHSAESRIGLAEVLFAGLIVVAVLGFALTIVR